MPLLIGALVTALINALRAWLPGIVGRILLTFGIGFATQTLAMPALIGFVQSRMAGMPSVLLAYAGALGIDVAVTMVLSAIAAGRLQRVALSKVTG